MTAPSPAGLREALDDHELMKNPAECTCGEWTYRDERPGNYFNDHLYGVIRAALAAAEPGRQSPCDDEQLATAFAKGVVAAHESLAADEPGLDVERLADLFMDLRLNGPAADGWTYQHMARHYAQIIAARLREDAP